MVNTTRSLFISTLLLATIVSANLGAANHHGARDHGRMMRKRQLGVLDPHPTAPVQNPGGAPPPPQDSLSLSSTTPASSSTPTSTSKGWDPLGGLTSAIGGLFPHSTTTTTATSASSTSIAEVSLSRTTTTPAATSTTTTQVITTTEGHSTRTVLALTTVAAPQQGASNPSAATSRQVGIARATIVVLVAVAGSIGAAFLIWTAIRKWKFRASRGLEDRNNINWNPDADAAGYDDFAEKASRRGRPASEMSFGSHDGINSQGGTTMYGSTTMGSGHPMSGPSMPTNRNLDYDLQHDFTAGPASSHQFYNDALPAHPPALSSSPPMVENNLTRGSSLTRSVARNDDPYGGYEDAYDDGLAPHHGGASATQPIPRAASAGMPPAHQF